MVKSYFVVAKKRLTRKKNRVLRRLKSEALGIRHLVLVENLGDLKLAWLNLVCFSVNNSKSNMLYIGWA